MDRRAFLAGASALALAQSGLAMAQDTFPSRPIRLIVPFPPGGTTDVFARLFAVHFGKALDVPIVVENKSGAGGLLGTGEARRAEANGYTLIFQSPTAGITGPLTRRAPPYDPVADFSHIAILGSTPVVLAVGAQSGIQSLKDLSTKAAATPGGLSYATGGTGGGPHLAAELLRARAGGFSATHVPYRGAAPAIQDLISGQVAYMTDTFVPLLPLHKEGRIRIIAVLGTERAAVAPEVPTAREQGIDVVARIANYLTAPPKVPAERIQKLSAAAKAAMAQPEVVERLAALAYVPMKDTSAAYAQRFIADEVALWKPVIDAAGIQLD